MPAVQNFLVFLAAFGFVVLASRQIGDFFSRLRLPLISGFLIAGIVAGPFILDIIHKEALAPLHFVDQMALAFIALAAGGELQIRFVRGHIRSILTVLTAQTAIVLAAGVVAFVLLSDSIPFMQGIARFQEVLAISLVAATIMVARSPSSALAIIKELRAKGPFTAKVLGATVLTDALVIIVFATAVSIAAGLIEGGGFSVGLLALVVIEILIDIGLGVLVGLLLRWLMHLRFSALKRMLILVIGYLVFVLAEELHGVHLFGIGLFSEPLLICMTAGFYLVNFTRYTSELNRVIEDLSAPVFIAFFTLVGISLELSVLAEAWAVALILVVVRFAGMFLGSLAGGAMAGDPPKHNLLAGFAYLTQAGVSVGLANEIAMEFPPWGQELATLSIGVIVINQVIGPPFFKWVVNQVGEAHPRAESPAFDGVRDALIFGLDSQSLALARQLRGHGWNARIICRDPERMRALGGDENGIVSTSEDLSAEMLRELELGKADAVVALLTDEENYRLCELNYEHFGVRDFVVVLHDRTNFQRFHDLGALIVDPSTAIVSLLDHLVRSPVAASLLLGMEDGQDIIDLEVRDPALHGRAIRDLRLPPDVLIVSVTRDTHPIISLGYTRLYLGDQVTLVGSVESLDEVMVMFDE